MTPRIGDRDWKDIWLDSPEYQKMRQEIEDIKREGLARPPPDRQNESTCKSLDVSKTVTIVLILYRRHIVLDAAQRGCETEQLGPLAVTRIRLQQAICPRLYLPRNLPVFPAARSQHTRPSIPYLRNVSQSMAFCVSRSLIHFHLASGCPCCP